MPQPRFIIHGGAGNISRKNLSPDSYLLYAASLLEVNRQTASRLACGASALDAATEAVVAMEGNPLFNCAKGAVFTREGTIELEASVMVSRGYRKRGCGVVLIKRVKNPVRLAREMLIRGGVDGNDGDSITQGGGAQGHSVLGGPTAEALAKQWGLDMVDEDYFWTRKRWDQHKRGLKGKELRDCLGAEAGQGKGKPMQADGWDGQEYLSQGTVGCVVLDRYGTLCVATSTGGLTNKLSGRIGDTPTIGAGFWAEEWEESKSDASRQRALTTPKVSLLYNNLLYVLGDCLPRFGGYLNIEDEEDWLQKEKALSKSVRAVAMSGTGNGDSFLRLAATRTAGAIARFSGRSLAFAVKQVAGPGGDLQNSAGDCWGKTGEGEGGIIGIELVNGKGKIVCNFNCGGMFRTWIDDDGKERVMVFLDEY
ncbi:MAG: hypothetical protein Q9167_000339 [Letrouitia subvulpina]